MHLYNEDLHTLQKNKSSMLFKTLFWDFSVFYFLFDANAFFVLMFSFCFVVFFTLVSV